MRLIATCIYRRHQPNKDGFKTFGAWVNSYALKHTVRPLVLAASADLADSTALSGFGGDFEDQKGPGWYDRKDATDGAIREGTVSGQLRSFIEGKHG